MIDDLGIEPVADGLRFRFRLPKGAYATTLLREFMRTQAACAEAMLDEEDA